ncbi:hypothetical protein AHAS_Ahas15G0202200 [Arachis hypogaea]
MWAKVVRNFKSPNMNLYNRTTDPRHHLSNFRSSMYLTDALDATCSKAFSVTLTKAAMKLFDSIPPRSIMCFDNLAGSFVTNFSFKRIRSSMHQAS